MGVSLALWSYARTVWAVRDPFASWACASSGQSDYGSMGASGNITDDTPSDGSLLSTLEPQGCKWTRGTILPGWPEAVSSPNITTTIGRHASSPRMLSSIEVSVNWLRVNCWITGMK